MPSALACCEPPRLLPRRVLNPAAGPTWEIPDDVDDDYLAQMESEHRIKERGRWIWKQIGSRSNHLWDAECLQVVAATMLKIVGREAAEQSGAETLPTAET